MKTGTMKVERLARMKAVRRIARNTAGQEPGVYEWTAACTAAGR